MIELKRKNSQSTKHSSFSLPHDTGIPWEPSITDIMVTCAIEIETISSNNVQRAASWRETSGPSGPASQFLRRGNVCCHHHHILRQ